LKVAHEEYEKGEVSKSFDTVKDLKKSLNA